MRLAIHLSGWMALPVSRRNAVLRALPDHIRRSRARPGCLRFDVWLDPVGKRRLLVDEVFISRSELTRHGAGLQRRRWGQVTKGLERHYATDTARPGDLAAPRDRARKTQLKAMRRG